MIERVIRTALEQRLIVLLVVLGLIVSGVAAFRHLPIDAFPDVTPVQIQVITKAPSLAPAEIERLVTFPLEIEFTNLPGKTELRSVSKFGLSVITVVFEDKMDIYFARQLVLERMLLAQSRLPQNAEPELGPVSTGLSEVFMYLVEGSTQTLRELRTLQDWVIRPMLRAVPGLADVDTLGGMAKQYEVLVDPNRLTSFGLTLRQVHVAVVGNNQNAGGGYIEQGGDKLVIHGVGLARSVTDLEQIVVAAHKGTPIYLRDVAQVRQGTAIRLGGVTRDGKGEVLEGIAVMLRGGKSRAVVSAVKDKVELINGVLPAGVKMVPFYDRIELVARALDTVEKALLEGVAVVILVLYLFLRNLRGAIVVALTLPLAILATFLIMQQVGLSANLMSLGGLAISLGMIVDAAIVQVENVERHLSEQTQGRTLVIAERLPVVLRAVLEVRKPSLFGELIIALTFVPLLTLQGMEGKMFIPLALTVVIALLSSLLLSVTVIRARGDPDEAACGHRGRASVGPCPAAVSADVGGGDPQNPSDRAGDGRRARRRGGADSVHWPRIRADHGRRVDRGEYDAAPQHQPHRITEDRGGRRAGVAGDPGRALRGLAHGRQRTRDGSDGHGTQRHVCLAQIGIRVAGAVQS